MDTILIVAGAFIIATWVSDTASAHDGNSKSIDIDKAIVLVRSAEQKYKVFKWTSLDLSEDQNGNKYESSGMYELATKRIRVAKRRQNSSCQEENEPTKYDLEASFDGSIYAWREYHYNEAGVCMGGSGVISHSVKDCKLLSRFSIGCSGMFFAPFLFCERNLLHADDSYGLLSDFMQKWSDLKLIHSVCLEGDTLIVETRGYATDDYWKKIFYDLKNSLILKCQEYPQNPDIIAIQKDYVYTTNGQGDLFPQKIIVSLPYAKSLFLKEHPDTELPKHLQDVVIYPFSTVEINPQVTDEDFKMDFPTGFYVTDYVNKRQYKVGDELNADAGVERLRRVKKP